MDDESADVMVFPEVLESSAILTEEAGDWSDADLSEVEDMMHAWLNSFGGQLY